MKGLFIDKTEAEIALDNLIKKSRVHFYKPIQVAEILFRNRVKKDINLINLESYRIDSKKWRDKVSQLLVGRVSNSSSKYQDNLFEDNAMPPKYLSSLGKINNKSNGSIEKYIYSEFRKKLSDMNVGLNYCKNSTVQSFDFYKFINIFWNDPGLKRSIDKIYEILVYSIFSSLIDVMGININVKIKDPSNIVFSEFSDFSEKILGITKSSMLTNYPAKLFRVGVTNAADRGLDIWGNFGLAIQIKHLSLTEQVARDVSESISADRIIIVCKDAEELVIKSFLTQIGWKSKIQAIVTINELKHWYDRALKKSSNLNLGKKILSTLSQQIKLEFPSSEDKHLKEFFTERGY